MKKTLVALLSCLVLAACDGDPAGSSAVDADADGYDTTVDCNDSDPSIHPGATETCTATMDLNCDGSFGSVDTDGDGVVACLDCNDANASVHPGATEVCDANSIDEDCSGAADDADANATGKTVFFLDSDQDGYAGSTTASHCHAPAHYLATSTDCDDTKASVHPGATEVCDGVDQDCDSTVDFGSTVPTHYATIQDAIDHASSGTHVCVLSGSYVDTMFVKNRTGLIVEGQDRDSVLFDGKLSSQAVQLRNSSVTVRNFTMTTTGSSGMVAGLYGGTPVLENVRIHDVVQTTDWCNGVLMIDGSDATLRDVQLDGNQFVCATGSSGVVTINNGNKTATFERVSIVDNVFSVGQRYRGAIQLYNHDLDASNLVIANNSVSCSTASCTFYAHGIGGEGAVALALSNATIAMNVAGTNMEQAGATAFWGVSSAFVRNLIVAFNTSDLEKTARLLLVPAGADVAYVDAFGNDVEANTDWIGIADPSMVSGYVTDDPSFASLSGTSALGWDLSLASGSALVDTGDPSLQDPDGTRSDYGAYGGPGGTW